MELLKLYYFFERVDQRHTDLFRLINPIVFWGKLSCHNSLNEKIRHLQVEDNFPKNVSQEYFSIFVQRS